MSVKYYTRSGLEKSDLVCRATCQYLVVGQQINLVFLCLFFFAHLQNIWSLDTKKFEFQLIISNDLLFDPIADYLSSRFINGDLLWHVFGISWFNTKIKLCSIFFLTLMSDALIYLYCANYYSSMPFWEQVNQLSFERKS